MPELPEVERARRQLEAVALGKRISKIYTTEDTIVYSGVTHSVFASECTGKIVKEVKRKGKNFYMILDSPPHPIFHFGMAGSSQTLGRAADIYRVPRAKNDKTLWPPKYVKACLSFVDPDAIQEDVIEEDVKEEGENGEIGEKEVKSKVREWAFCDSRRLGRIKLIYPGEGQTIEEVEPLSLLGRDPFLDMPSVEWLGEKLAKRNAPIKAVLLDQNGPLCGIGNWMIDEILFQSRLHPSHPASHLTPTELATLHAQIKVVTDTACSVNANSRKFPSDWLFRYRWGKGKKVIRQVLLPNGDSAPITFETVGGRTSAIVEAVQIMPPHILEIIEAKRLILLERKIKREGKKAALEAGSDVEEGVKEEGEEAEEGEEYRPVVGIEETFGTSPHFRKQTRGIPLQLKEEANSEGEEEEMAEPVKKKPRKARVTTKAKNQGEDESAVVKAPRKSRSKKVVVSVV